MDTLFYKISQVLGITIIHSLWQGLVIYMTLSLILQFLVDKPAALKYKLAFGALSIMLAWFAYTLYTEVGNYTALNAIAKATRLNGNDLAPVAVSQWTNAPIDRYYFLIAGYLPYITVLYLAGLVFNTLKIMVAWNNIYRIRQYVTQAGFQQQVNQLAQKTGISKFVKVAFSEFIDVPCITGFLKPVILLPCGISTYLSVEEIRSILLHELAHIKRNDYLLNIVQQVISIVLFFNPFSRLINKIINNERENSCDDTVVRTTGTPLIYAQALLKLEQNKQQAWHLALAATGNKYHLLHRIERIMKTQKNTLNIRPALIALVLLTCSLSSIAWLNPKIENGKVSVKAVINPLTTDGLADTVKGKSKSAKPALKARKIVAKKINGKVTYYDAYADDAKMKALEAEIEKHSANLEQYNSPEFTKMQEQLEKKSQELEALYNDPKIKQIQEDMEKKGAAYEKMADNPKLKELQEKLEANSKKIEQYYNSPAFSKKQKELEKASALLVKSDPGSAEYKKHLAELTKLSLAYAEHVKSPAMKEQIELSTKLATEASAYYLSPEFAKQREELQAYGDSMSKAFTDPKIKEKQEKIHKISQEMNDYQNKAEIKREKEAIKEATKKIREYQKSPEYKKKMKDDLKSANKDVKERIRQEIAAARLSEEIHERAEAPERKEAPEKKEAPERKEAPEKKERPEPRERKEAPETTQSTRT